jgi:hypothetical protein
VRLLPLGDSFKKLQCRLNRNRSPIFNSGVKSMRWQTLSLTINDIERIDRIIMNAEARRNVVLRETDRHRSSLLSFFGLLQRALSFFGELCGKLGDDGMR